jgi:flagellar basal body-associated protein FliL
MNSKLKVIIPLIIVIVALAAIFYAYQKITSEPKSSSTTKTTTVPINTGADSSKVEQDSSTVQTPAEIEKTLPAPSGNVNDTVKDIYIDVDNEEDSVIEEEGEEGDEFSAYTQELSDLGELGNLSEL